MKSLKLLSIHRDLGIRSLLPEWKALFSPAHVVPDVVAGVTVACLAIPLSLAIALASGVPPAAGLVTAIVAGFVCALFGGTTLGVSGPAAAMSILVAAIVEDHGLASLLIVGCWCGVLQLMTGVLGLGRVVRLVPLSVVEGFTAGIGAIILIAQLPPALGLPAPAKSHVFHVMVHIGDLIRDSQPIAVASTVTSLALILLLPRVTRRVPPHLVAVVVPTLGVFLLGLDIETIGAIPRRLPWPQLPPLHALEQLTELAIPSLLVFALASLESLLSASAVDKMAGTRSSPDQELIGQGLGNIACALFSGIPATAVIARSGANVQMGAKTRRAALVHSLVDLATVVALAPVMSLIPVAALAGLLIAIALRMVSRARRFTRGRSVGNPGSPGHRRIPRESHASNCGGAA